MIKYYKIRPSLYFIESFLKSYNQLYNFTQNSHNAQYTTVWKGFKVDKISINWLHLINECRVWFLIYNSTLYSLIQCLCKIIDLSLFFYYGHFKLRFSIKMICAFMPQTADTIKLCDLDEGFKGTVVNHRWHS